MSEEESDELTFRYVYELCNGYVPSVMPGFETAGVSKKYFTAVYHHFVASRNDAHWYFYDDNTQEVFLYWAAEWCRLCPMYFSWNYPDKILRGTFRYALILEGSAEDFPEGDSESTLMYQPRVQRFDWEFSPAVQVYDD